MDIMYIDSMDNDLLSSIQYDPNAVIEHLVKALDLRSQVLVSIHEARTISLIM
jgi:hypothetical protein